MPEPTEPNDTPEAPISGTPLFAANEKMTYVSLYGIERSREIAAELTNKALAECDRLSPNSGFLKALVGYMQNRIN